MDLALRVGLDSLPKDSIDEFGRGDGDSFLGPKSVTPRALIAGRNGAPTVGSQ